MTVNIYVALISTLMSHTQTVFSSNLWIFFQRKKAPTLFCLYFDDNLQLCTFEYNLVALGTHNIKENWLQRL